MFPNWISKYIGIPFVDKGRDHDGCDCWGLLRLVYLEQFNILLPSYVEGYHDTRDNTSIEKLIYDELTCSWLKVNTPKYGDAISLKIKGHPWHCGLAIDHRMMLHCMRGHNTVLERFDKWKWIKRIDGYFEHQNFCKTKPIFTTTN